MEKRKKRSNKRSNKKVEFRNGEAQKRGSSETGKLRNGEAQSKCQHTYHTKKTIKRFRNGDGHKTNGIPELDTACYKND